MTGVLVVPVNQIHRSIRSASQIDPTKVVIVGQQQIPTVMAYPAGGPRNGFQNITVHSVAMHIVEIDTIAIFVRPVITEVDHAAAVRVASTGVQSRACCMRFMSPPRMVLDVADVMCVISNCGDVFIGIGVEVLTTLSLVSCSLNHMPQVRNHTGCDEGLTPVIEVHTPRIAGAIHEGFKDVLLWMIAPNRGVQRQAGVVCSPWAPDFRVREDAMAAVQPAVRSPDECIQCFMSVLPAKTVPQHDRSGRDVFGKGKSILSDGRHGSGARRHCVRNIVAILVRNEHQVRGRSDKHTAKTDFQSADQIQSLNKCL